ncbi:MAG: hypothetical protein M1822_008086 [Bathelium mastoideum]|nr:MAG: hypothetical protein M1822_008086 [Bathelium mastoideum]
MENSLLNASTSKPYKHACERCRNSKLRCALESVQATGKCNRCAEADAECVFKPLAPRHRRKRTDARVTSLEKELIAMKSTLNSLRDVRPASSPMTMPIQTPSTGSYSLDSLQSNESPLLLNCISDQLAMELFQDFVDFILPQYPIVVIQESFDSLRVSKPMLLLAVVTAASSTREPDLFRLLHSQLVRQVTDRAIINGERSTELIQSIIILGIWYCAPEDLQRLNFYQWIHIAGTMALQMGLAGARVGQEPDYNQYDYEKLRTMFAVFQSCSQAAISLRRQCLVTFTQGMQSIFNMFSSSVTSVQDKRLVAWVNLQVIAEDVEKTIRHDVVHNVNGLVDRFDQWERNLAPGVMNASLCVHFYYCKAKLFESALDADQALQELVPPFLGKQAKEDASAKAISPSYVKAILGLVSACHAILDTLISMEDRLLRGCPTPTYVRSLYALKVLTMLRRAQSNPSHAICRIVDADSLRAENYISSVCDKLDAAAGQVRRRVPFAILGVAKKIATQLTEEPSKGAVHRDANDMKESHSPTGTLGMMEPASEVRRPIRGVPEDSMSPSISTVQPMPLFHANGFGVDALPEMTFLSDFEEMAMPDMVSTHDEQDGLSGLQFWHFDEN